jgi:hypothetical protein
LCKPRGSFATLGRPDPGADSPCGNPRKLPVVLSADEVVVSLEAVPSLSGCLEIKNCSVLASKERRLVLDPVALVIILTGRRNDRRIDKCARLHLDRLGLELAGDRVEHRLVQIVCNKAPARPDEGGALRRPFRPREPAEPPERRTIVQSFGELHIGQIIPDRQKRGLEQSQRRPGRLSFGRARYNTERLDKSGGAAEPRSTTLEPPKGYPLGLVLKACPDIVDYAADGISNWRDLMTTAAQVRGYLGISPSAYEDALDILGQENAAVVIACILQRAQHINSAGGYLRALTDKARAGEFSVGPMLMAALKTKGVTARMAG